MTSTAVSIQQYIAMHAGEAQQSQAPRINVTWDNASIEDVVAGFAAFSGRTIVISKGITGNVTGEIKNQPWDLAFKAVLEAQGLAYQVLDGGIINVVPRADLARADSTVPIETRLVRVNYAKATALVPAIASIVTKSRGQVVADSTTNSLVITDVASRVDQVADFVRGLDIPTPQVSIQAKIIFVNRTDVEELGVKYDLGSATQFFNTLVQRPDPSTAKPVSTNGTAVPNATVATGTFKPEQVIVDLGGNSLSALGNPTQAVVNPALQLIFSPPIANFDLPPFLQPLHHLNHAHIQAEPTVTTLEHRPAQMLVSGRVPLRINDSSA